MTTQTLLQLRTKIQQDLDLQDEDFISDTECNQHIQEAVKKCERLLRRINENYFETYGNLTFVSGTADVSYPADIFARKVIKIFYDNGSKKYEIKRIRNRAEIQDVRTGDDYRWYPVNPAANAPKLRFFPTPAENSSTNVTIWYEREATVLASDADVLEIPEAVELVIQDAKNRCYEKEGNPRLLKGMEDSKGLVDEFVATLKDMVLDGNTEIQPDMSFYEEFIGYQDHDIL